MVSAKKLTLIFLSLVGLVSLGAFVFIGTVRVYFGIDGRDMITTEEVNHWDSMPSLPYGQNLTTSPKGDDWSRLPREKIPRILHQTWKDENLPERWIPVREQCLKMHSDYEYMLWTDASSRSFIAQHYPWFLPVFDGYAYNIQRADVIRYFVLHHYGGVYLDLDIGCQRRIDPLLHFDVILPETIPVGISNDLIFSSPRHPFMELVIHNLVTFDHTYGTNYPTVMFSTGPMFLSAQYNLWPMTDGDHGGVRVLPKHLYGKHATEEEAPHAFFTHFYGSSWHAEDAGLALIIVHKAGLFLGYTALVLVIFAVLRFAYIKLINPKGSIALPHSSPPDRSSTPLPSSRPGSPAPLLRRTNSRDGTKPQGAGAFYWVPMWYPSSDAPSPSSNNWSSYLPTTYDDHRYRPVGAVSDTDDDAVSVHSMHTIRQKKKRRSAPAHHDSDSEDLESQRTVSPGSKWFSGLFGKKSIPVVPSVQVTPPPPQTPTRSRPASRPNTPQPPEYDSRVEDQVDRFLNEMEPTTTSHEKNQ